MWYRATQQPSNSSKQCDQMIDKRLLIIGKKVAQTVTQPKIYIKPLLKYKMTYNKH
jgi:hypothetical protein